MTLLVLGLALWIAAHVFKRAAPDLRASLGETAKRGVAVAVLLSIVLMVIGYRQAGYVLLYDPPSWGRHVNNLLVLAGFYLFAVSGAKTRVHQYLRHPQLTGFSLWAAAHVLVNGDLASLILFGGLLIWALAEMVLINRAVPDWAPPPVPPMRKEIVAVAVSLALYGVVAAIHTWLGYNPFAG